MTEYTPNNTPDKEPQTDEERPEGSPEQRAALRAQLTANAARCRDLAARAEGLRDQLRAAPWLANDPELTAQLRELEEASREIHSTLTSQLEALLQEPMPTLISSEELRARLEEAAPQAED